MNTNAKMTVREDGTMPVVRLVRNNETMNPLKVAPETPAETDQSPANFKIPPPILGCFKGKDNDCL